MRTISFVAAVLLLSSPAWSEAPTSRLASECGLWTADRGTTGVAQCLSCHDGSVTAAMIRNEDTHPVDVSYEDAYARDPRSYRAPALLPVELKLANGKVTCATCHSATSPWSGHTALTMNGSGLCTACHLY